VQYYLNWLVPIFNQCSPSGSLFAGNLLKHVCMSSTSVRLSVRMNVSIAGTIKGRILRSSIQHDSREIDAAQDCFHAHSNAHKMAKSCKFLSIFKKIDFYYGQKTAQNCHAYTFKNILIFFHIFISLLYFYRFATTVFANHTLTHTLTPKTVTPTLWKIFLIFSYFIP